MPRLLLVLCAFSIAAPLLTACYAGQQPPPRVPVQHEPGQYKTCPGGASSC